MSGSLSEADCDLAVHGDDGGDTDMLSSSNKSTCDSLCETEEGINVPSIHCISIIYKAWLNLTKSNQKGLDGTSARC